jgi:iron complex transport system permease protein
MFGWHALYPFSVALAAFAGCVITLGVVYLLSCKNEGTHALILTGLALTTFLLAVEGALLYMLRDRYSLIQLWMEWGAGSFVDRSWSHVHQQLPLTLIGTIGCLRYRREMNLLSLGDEEALNLGVDVQRVRWRLFFFVALLIAGSLAASGIIPFFGLVLPHIVRRFVGSDHRILLPISSLLGALFLLLMELSLRALSITLLSIGQLSAFFGGLFYLTLLVRPNAYRKRA